MNELLCGVDIGGTFTDCVIVDEAGAVTTAKVLSTPDDYSVGVRDVLAAAADKLDTGIAELVSSIALLSHGTTIGTNALIERRGARVGLITTRGHEHVIHIMRGSRGITGRDLHRLCHLPSSQKPDPIVPKRLIRGVSERVDCFGNEIAPLDDDEAGQAIRELIAAGAESIAICFLWSFKAPEHELRVRDLVNEIAPDMFVTCSVDLVPKWGEYERTTAVALNAHMGPTVSDYLAGVDDLLTGLGYRNALQITQCAGGTVSVRQAQASPLLTLDSGPVAGTTGSAYLGSLMDRPNIITTDMGGTSFDVGLIRDGEPVASYVSLVNQYEYFLPRVSISAIGAGGGSIATVDPLTKSLRVGPTSAGSDPGPACYGRGGTAATVTDANLLLGRLDPENFAGGSIELDLGAAETAVGALGDQLGLSVVETAAGIARIVEFNMADLVRQTTIQQGYDPRDFILFAYGGAGPLHAAVYASALDIDTVVVPQREASSVWCAFGGAAADILHLYEQSEIMAGPWNPERVNTILARVGERGRRQLLEDGASDPMLSFSIDVRHKGQINEVEVPIEGERVDEAALDALARDFYDRYEELYGAGSAFRGAALEAVTFRCRARAETPKPRLVATAELSSEPPAEATRTTRPVWWDSAGDRVETPIIDGMALLLGNRVGGPALIETPDTTVVVPPTHELRVDAFGNFELTRLESS